MKIDIVYDNYTADSDFISGWGFSALIDGRILFDCGEEAESLLHNLAKHKFDLEKLEAVVISHEHWDHVGGLWELLKKRKGIKVYVCPGFSDKFKSKVKASGGMLVESQSVTDIDSKISLTGEIPSTYKGEPMPEQALMIKNEKGITLVTGCSHPGIISMIKIVKDIYPDLPMHMVLGGFHLMRSDEETIRSIAKEMMNLGVKNTAPTHCSGDEAKKIFHEIYGTDYYDIGAGSTVNI